MPKYGDNHLQYETCLDKHMMLQVGLLNCEFHHHVMHDMVREMAHLITEKVRFTETNDPGSYAVKVRADVYVLSPEEMGRSIREGILKDERIKELEVEAKFRDGQAKRIKELEEKLRYAETHSKALASDIRYTLDKK